MINNKDNERTVAELTFYYKKRRLASFIFDKQETADDFVEALIQVVGEKGMKDFSLRGEIKTVYTDEAILGEIDDYRTGKKKTKRTIFDLIKTINIEEQS